jgi:hypothetical protein
MPKIVIDYYRVEHRKASLNGYFINGSIFKVILESYHIEVSCLMFN